MARLAFAPFLRIFKDNGDVCPDATARWYLAGTTTPTDSFTSSALSTPNAAPVAANALGIFPAMWLADATQYKVVISGTGVTTQTIDEVYSTASLDQLSGDRRYLGLAGGAAYVTTGSSNAYVVSTGLSTTSLSTYETLLIRPNFTNSGAATLNIDGLGAKNIFNNGAALSAGDLVSGRIYPVCYDGTQFQLLSYATLDATLTAMAALTISSGTVIVGTGADTFSVVSYATLATSQAATKVAFSAHKNASSQASIASATPTKITFGTEAFDTGSYYDTTNSRWTPPAGKVRLNAYVYFTGSLSANTAVIVSIYKNGSLYRSGFSFVVNTGTGAGSVNCIDDASGTDYYEVYLQSSTSAGTITADGTANYTYFMGEQI